jgi:diguanylate cyclase (GGDEF)-like protein/PAS domain S-box-containing protein
MRFAEWITIINKLHKKGTQFFVRALFSDQYIPPEKDTLKYWQGNVFYFISVFFIVCGAPLTFFGAYMFFISRFILYAIVEVLISIIIAIVITRKSLSIRFRKAFIVIALYSLSFLLLVSAGLFGSGLVCVFFTLILAGCLLDKNQIFPVILANLILFTVLTAAFLNGYLDGTKMDTYKGVWLINVITTQVCGIILVLFINTMYRGLNNQTELIKKSKESLTASELTHKAMIANISDVIAIIDENGIIKYNSPNLEQRFGWTSDETFGNPFWDKIHPADWNHIKTAFKKLLEENGAESTVEVRYICKNIEIKFIELTAVNLKNDPNIKGILINFHDITERKKREDEILYLNYHDNLTGLYNHTFFENEKVRFNSENKLPLSLITGDINGLKIINESLGHAEGDKLLVTIARIIESSCRKEDILARIGGDQFCVLLPATSNEDAYEIMKKINKACKTFNESNSNELYHISISLGLATRTNISESIDSIFKIAEDHMYGRKLLEARSFHSSIIASMKMTLSEKSQETEQHAHRLVQLSKAVGQAIGITNQQFDELELFAMLHDIGKIGVEDQILNKHGRLTESEWVKMKKHSEIGYRIAMSSPDLISVAYYILTHHERWDGKGYPQQLMGESIPLLSRILAVADAYDAMTEDRPYRKGMPKQDAIAEIIKNAGTQFDPAIAKIFIELHQFSNIVNISSFL